MIVGCGSTYQEKFIPQKNFHLCHQVRLPEVIEKIFPTGIPVGKIFPSFSCQKSHGKIFFLWDFFSWLSFQVKHGKIFPIEDIDRKIFPVNFLRWEKKSCGKNFPVFSNDRKNFPVFSNDRKHFPVIFPVNFFKKVENNTVNISICGYYICESLYISILFKDVNLWNSIEREEKNKIKIKTTMFHKRKQKKLLLEIIAFSLKLKQKVEAETLVVILYLYLILKWIFQNTYCTKNVETFIFKNRAVINNHTFLFSSELLSPYFKSIFFNHM